MRYLAGFALVVAGFLADAAGAEDRRTITVSCQGRVQTVPDMATITLGVTHRDKVASMAMDKVSRNVAAILSALTGLGIEPRDMQTRNLSLSPIWEDVGPKRQDQRLIVGFVAANNLAVRVRKLADLGGVLDGVLEHGANHFSGLAFDIQVPEPLEDEARRRAVARCHEQAALLADAAGVTLGSVLTISDQGGSYRPQMLAARSGGGVPVAAGEISLTASVSMVFAIGE